MAAAFNDGGASQQYVQSLKAVLEGKEISYQSDPHEFNRNGEGSGELIGGNLALLAHVVGTSSDFKTRGRILFLEDVGFIHNVADNVIHILSEGPFSVFHIRETTNN